MTTPRPSPGQDLRYRHTALVRLTHWLNALAVAVLLGTGLNIFNAHPFLYWGAKGNTHDTQTRWLAIGAVTGPDGQQRGLTMLGTSLFDTTGTLGLSRGMAGQPVAIAFPSWSTLPARRDLATARNWHFAAAWLLILNGLAYLLHGLFSGHVRKRLLPRLSELRPRNIWHDVMEHLKLRFPTGDAALDYQVLQKLAYSATALLLLPLMVLSGLGMSPGVDAAWPWIVDLFGGRQTARSVHFIVTMLLVLFILVHLLMVMLAGPFRLLRGMVTGWQNVGART
jgi:thiosulfate reductase cytochrome b subunit